jgi:hypothetical protein
MLQIYAAAGAPVSAWYIFFEVDVVAEPLLHRDCGKTGDGVSFEAALMTAFRLGHGATYAMSL